MQFTLYRGVENNLQRLYSELVMMRLFAHCVYRVGQNTEPFLPRCMECRRGLAMRFLSVRPSVRLSVKRVYCDKKEEKSVQIFTPCERPFSLVL